MPECCFVLEMSGSIIPTWNTRRENWLLEVSAKQTDKCSQRDKSRADPSENEAEHRMGQCSQSNQQVLMEDNWLSEHNSSADLSLKLYAGRRMRGRWC